MCSERRDSEESWGENYAAFDTEFPFAESLVEKSLNLVKKCHLTKIIVTDIQAGRVLPRQKGEVCAEIKLVMMGRETSTLKTLLRRHLSRIARAMGTYSKFIL